VILFFCFEPFELPLPYSCSYSIICLIWLQLFGFLHHSLLPCAAVPPPYI
jgi:hypothetical protein